ncbi:family 20 glycosylhydrolase [Mobiluncus mulieris]|nr:family 20 glycosylhydrolase [Mobiluncus mulieris]
MATLFPGVWMHIGGDECAYKQWEADPEILDWVKKRGVASVAQLQSWFIDQALEVSQRRGKRLAAWDEICALTGDEDFLVFVWNEAEGLERIRNTNQEFVFTDARTLYLNWIDPKASSPQKGMLPGISVSDILAAPWEETANSRCVGVQACLWTEFILDEADMAQMLFPRLLAVSERMWNPQVDVFEAAQRVETEYHRLVAVGVFDS